MLLKSYPGLADDIGCLMRGLAKSEDGGVNFKKEKSKPET